MAVPSRIRRMRKNVGNQIEFTYVSNNGSTRNFTGTVKDVEFDPKSREYVLVAKLKKATRRFWVEDIERPVRYES